MKICRVLLICGIGTAILAADVRAQSDIDQLRVIERQRLRSLVDANMDVARRLHADDFQLITPTGGVVSKDEYLSLIESTEVDYIEWEPDEIEIKVYNDAAVVRYQARLRIVVRGQPDAPTGRFWHMDLYERRNGQWQAVWSQATQIR